MGGGGGGGGGGGADDWNDPYVRKSLISVKCALNYDGLLLNQLNTSHEMSLILAGNIQLTNDSSP